jgi:hypothetical protein
VLACVYSWRLWRNPEQVWHDGIETSLWTLYAYLWWLGRYGQRHWAPAGTSTYGTTAQQLVYGIARFNPQWGPAPTYPGRACGQEQRAAMMATVDAYVRRHRSQVLVWLSQLQELGLIDYRGVTDDNGFWHRTNITWKPCPKAAPQLRTLVQARQAGFAVRERRHEAAAQRAGREGRIRRLTVIRRTLVISRAERRRRGQHRRRRQHEYTERVRARAAMAEFRNLSLIGHPIEPETTSQGKDDVRISIKSSDVGNTREADCQQAADRVLDRVRFEAKHQQLKVEDPAYEKAGREGGESTGEITHAEMLSRVQAFTGRRWEGLDPSTGDGKRWMAYHEVCDAARVQDPFERTKRLAAQRWRRQQLLTWDLEELPELWWLAELFVATTFSPAMAAAPGGFKLAFLSPDRDRETIKSAFADIRRAAAEGGIAANRPTNPVAALAAYLIEDTRPQTTFKHGIAVELRGFMKYAQGAWAYAKATNPARHRAAVDRAIRRVELERLSERINRRLAERNGVEYLTDGAKLRRAAETMCASSEPRHRKAARKLRAEALTTDRLLDRDTFLAERGRLTSSSGQYRLARTYAERWGLTEPGARLRENAAAQARALLERSTGKV